MPTNTLCLHVADPAAEPGESSTATASAVTPLAVGAVQSAALFSASEASWWRWHSAGKVPTPIRLGGRTLWLVDELHRWAQAGCPARSAWEAMKGANIPGGGRR